MRHILLAISCSFFVNVNAQKINLDDFYGTWQLDKYSDDEQYYHPPKKEMGDVIRLNQDMTFTTVSEGKKTQGTWLYNTNGRYIEFKEEQGTKEKMAIHFLSKKSMVATYDTDEYRIWEVHFVKEKQNNP